MKNIKIVLDVFADAITEKDAKIAEQASEMSWMKTHMEILEDQVREMGMKIEGLRKENAQLKEKTVTAATDDGATNPTTLYTKFGLESIKNCGVEISE